MALPLSLLRRHAGCLRNGNPASYGKRLHSIASYRYQHHHHPYRDDRRMEYLRMLVEHRWYDNIARLYARRILLMASAAAAAAAASSSPSAATQMEGHYYLEYDATSSSLDWIMNWIVPTMVRAQAQAQAQKQQQQQPPPKMAFEEVGGWSLFGNGGNGNGADDDDAGGIDNDHQIDWTTDVALMMIERSMGRNGWERAWSSIWRVCQLSFLASPLIFVLAPLSYAFPTRTTSDWFWSYSLWSLERAGPTFIKLVQWATSRQDLFSQEFCQHLGPLRDRTRGHPWSETERLLREEWGPEWKQFVLIEDTSGEGGGDDDHDEKKRKKKQNPTPIGSGCIAQVYRGRLLRAPPPPPSSSSSSSSSNHGGRNNNNKNEDGHGHGDDDARYEEVKVSPDTELAIKVQHPGIWHKVCADLYILGHIASALESIPYLNLHYLSLYDTVLQFGHVLLPQLDLRREKDHLERFHFNFADDERIQFPRPLPKLTTRRVLTETFCEGLPILHYTTAPLPVRKQLASLGLETTLKMIFLHDFLHGDLHPGNILVHENPPGHFTLNILDCGLVVEMGPQQHANVVQILGAFTRRDGRKAAQLMVDTSRNPPPPVRHHTTRAPSSSSLGAQQHHHHHQGGSSSNLTRSPSVALDVELFVRGVEQIVSADEKQNFVEHVGDYITDICYLAVKHHVKLEAAFISAALAVEIMEGIATALYKDIQVASTALPMVMKAEVMHKLGGWGKSIRM